MLFLGLPVEIWVAIITAVSGILVKRQTDVRKFERQLAEKEEALQEEKDKQEILAKSEFRKTVIGPLVNIQKLENIGVAIRRLIKETEIDRVLILVAVNGVDHPTHASCIWDKRDPEEDWKYIDVPIDDDYRDRLKEAERRGYSVLITDKIQGTRIGKIYKAEGVRYSVWTSVGKRAALKTRQVAYCFCSWSTHQDVEFHAETLQRILNLNAQIRLMMQEAGYAP
jgi:hypothetical protein